MTGRTAMRVAAAVWLAGAVIGLGVDQWQQSIWDEREAGADLDEMIERITLVAWVNQGTHLVVTSVIAIAASAWAHGRRLVRVGQGLLAATLLVGIWLVAVRATQSTTAEMENLQHIGMVNSIAFFVGLALLLAPTRAPLAARIGFVTLSAAWLLYMYVLFEPSASTEQYAWVFSAVPLVLAASWSAGLWLAAPHEIDAPVETSGIGVDDPARLHAAGGVALLRIGMIARIALTVASVAMLVAVRTDPGSSSSVVWLAALGHCVLAIVIASALTRYGSLPDQALERGHVTTVIVCLASAALLELYGASQAAALFDVLGRADGGDFSGMPRLSELEAMQTRAQWVGRIATLVGLVAAVSLAISLRKTAMWLDDFKAADRASTLVVLTILGGGCASIIVAVAQSGAIRDLGAIVAAMLGALAAAVAILVMWMRLLGSVSAALRRAPVSPTTSSS